MKPNEISVGQRVLYRPGLGGPLFLATVCSAPWLLGGHTWVVAINELPDTYREHVGLPGKKIVHAAPLSSLKPAGRGVKA
jgi:hypothetical protein